MLSIPHHLAKLNGQAVVREDIVPPTTTQCECGSLRMLLNTLPEHAIVQVMPLQRIVPHGGMRLLQRQIHLTCKHQHLLFYASCWAVESLHLGTWGRLVAPERRESPSQQLLDSSKQIWQSLFHCLLEVLENEPRIAAIQAPVRYVVADPWGNRADMTNSGIVFVNGAWHHL